MRAVLLLPLVALALISTAAAQEQTPLSCQNCWADERGNIPACKNLSKEDMDRLGKMSDADVAKVSDDHELAPIKACLCELSSEAPTILQTCENRCPPEMAKGLQAEASIVANGVCYVPQPKLQSGDGNTTDNSTSAEGKDGAGSGGSSASGDPEKTNSEGGNDANKPSTAGASSVQWSGALLTVVAAMVSAVAF